MMDTNIAIFATSYVALRLLIVSMFSYAFYRVLRPARMTRSSDSEHSRSINRAGELRSR